MGFKGMHAVDGCSILYEKRAYRMHFYYTMHICIA